MLLRPAQCSQLPTPSHSEGKDDEEFSEKFNESENNENDFTSEPVHLTASNTDIRTQGNIHELQRRREDTEKLSSKCMDDGVDELRRPSKVPLFKAIVHWRAAVLLLSQLVFGFGVSVVFVMLPSFALMNGITTQQISMIYMVTAAIGFFYRLALVALGKLTSVLYKHVI